MFDTVDHNLMFVPYVASEDADTLDVVFRSPEDELRGELGEPLSDPTHLNKHSI